MKKTEFDIKKVEIKDLDGNSLVAPTLGKELGNYIYKNLATIDWLEKAKLIHQELPVELTDAELADLSDLIKSGSCRLILAAKDAIIEYINKLSK